MASDGSVIWLIESATALTQRCASDVCFDRASAELRAEARNQHKTLGSEDWRPVAYRRIATEGESET